MERIILENSITKCKKSIAVLNSSLAKIEPFDENKPYTYDELEPYDALADRFVRVVEVSLKFLRTYYIYHEGIQADTLRDILNYSEKNNLIGQTELWLEMREVRNRIVHDYLPVQQKLLYDDIMGAFKKEIESFNENLNSI